MNLFFSNTAVLFLPATNISGIRSGKILKLDEQFKSNQSFNIRKKMLYVEVDCEFIDMFLIMTVKIIHKRLKCYLCIILL